MYLLLLLLSTTTMVELYLAQRRTERTELFYALAALTLFGALLTVGQIL